MIVEICVKHKVEYCPYLSEAQKRIRDIDNKVKHVGYSPTKLDCINVMKCMQDLVSKLRDAEIKLGEEIREEIFKAV